ncbi:hypothetical protein J4421_04410 [Candidatus Woesearchaeota archaeon]|nr:hypothetical protein [Candidatus Woesearchaeota archaeon]
MKHTPPITLLLLLLFLSAQFIGIFILTKYIDIEKSQETGQTEFRELPVGERPPLQEETSFLPLMMAILIGTALLLLLIKYKLSWIWRGWFLIAIVVTLMIAFAAFVNTLIAFVLALSLAVWKVFKPNFWVHNFTELFIYAGLAVIFVPLFSLLSIVILLILIALYDAYAVWKSKHMVTLAKSQVQEKAFAGLLIPYEVKGAESSLKVEQREKVPLPQKARTAILGGGDIGFPLLFAGVVLKEFGLWQSLVIPLFAAGGLAFLLWRSEEKKFYPAMPFIGAGCLIGLGLVFIIGQI